MGFFSRLFGTSPERAKTDASSSARPKTPADRVVGSARVVQMDAERVEDPSDYTRVVSAFVAASDGALSFDAIDCRETESGTRVLTLKQGTRQWRGRLEGDTDWVDSERLIDLLNGVPCASTSVVTS